MTSPARLVAISAVALVTACTVTPPEAVTGSQSGQCLAPPTGSGPVIAVLFDVTQATADPGQIEETTELFGRVLDHGFEVDARLIGQAFGPGPRDADLAVNTQLIAEGPNDLYRRNDQRCKRDAVLETVQGALAGTVAGPPDVLGALRTLSSHLVGLSPGGTADIVILSSMVNGTSPLELDEVRTLDRPVDDLLAELEGRGALPDCRGWRVYVAGAGRPATEPTDAISDARLEDFWRGFFQRCGAHLLAYAPELAQFPLPDVPLIPLIRRAADVVARLPEGVLFGTGSASLRPDADPVLQQVLAVVQRHPGGPVGVDGFTDSEGEPARNMVLSEQRALAVAGWLVAKGVPRERITTHGHGAAEPVGDNGTPLGRQQNRRVEVTVADAATPASRGGRP